MKLGKFKLKHYINYLVIGIFTAVMAGMVFSGNKLDSSTVYLLEKISISMVLAVSL